MMADSIPDPRFRLPHTFTITPQLSVDDGPGRGILFGQNAERANYEAILIGKHAETPHRGVWMDVRGAHVLYVMGKRRSGKSYTLGAIAEALVSETWIRQGSDRQAVLILDTMNVFLTMPFSVIETYAEDSEQTREVAKWELQPESPPLSMFAPAGTAMPPEIPSQVITLRASDLGPEEWCGLFEIDPFVDPMGHLLTTLYAKLTTEGIVDRHSGKRQPPPVEFSIADMIAAVNRDRDLDNFARDTRDALTRRLQALERLPLFGPAGLDVRQLLRAGRISVMLLRDLDVSMRAVMVSLIVKRVMQLRAISEQQERMISVHLARAETYKTTQPDRASQEIARADECTERAKAGLPRSWLIIDEAHNYVPARSAVPCRRPLKKYVDEGRNLGLSIVVATQQPSGLDPSIQRNADMLLIHALSHHDDIAAAMGMVNTSEPDTVTLDGRQNMSGSKLIESLVRSLPPGYALVSTDRANRLFPVRVRPRSTVHGGADY
jgi:hypothetical protein